MWCLSVASVLCVWFLRNVYSFCILSGVPVLCRSVVPCVVRLWFVWLVCLWFPCFHEFCLWVRFLCLSCVWFYVLVMVSVVRLWLLYFDWGVYVLSVYGVCGLCLWFLRCSVILPMFLFLPMVAMFRVVSALCPSSVFV